MREVTAEPAARSETMIETVLSVSMVVGLAAVSLISLTLLAIAMGWVDD